MGVERIAPKSPSWCRDFRNEDEVTIGAAATKAMLLRHGRRYKGKSSWTLAHEWFLADVSFAHPAEGHETPRLRRPDSGCKELRDDRSSRVK
jgi:hypothetical protein